MAFANSIGEAAANPTSWVVVERATGRAVCELHGASAVAKLNAAKYEAVPVLTYLQSINGHSPATAPHTPHPRRGTHR